MVALTAAFVVCSATAAPAEPVDKQTRIRAGLAEAMHAVDDDPRFKQLTADKRKALVEFVTGNTLFVVLHEMGHVVISEMGLPVLGREEDAADSFATVTALTMKSEFSERVLIEAAKGWYLSDRRDKKEGNKMAFYDEHGVDLQRAYNVVCLMVGSDPEKFKKLADEAQLPEERQGTCVGDYSNASWSWDTLLKPHRRSAGQPKTKLTVRYLDEKKAAPYAGVLRHMGLLEAVADHAANDFRWRAPFTLEARSCEDSNAEWNLATRTLTFCYEIARDFGQLFLGYSDALDTARTQSGK
jgi:hypothetical protein